MTGRHQRRGALAPLAVIVLLAAACADGADGADTAAEESTDTATTQTDDPSAEDPDGSETDDAGGDDAEENDDSGDDDTGRTEHDGPRPRLAIADASSPTVVYLDLDSGEVLTDLTLDAEILTHGAALTADGRYLLAPHEDGVTVVDGGAWSEPHGSHAHHYTSEPSIVGRIDGPDPSHLVSGDGRSALFFDGDGDTIVLDEAGFDHGHLDELVTLTAGEAHHGFTVPSGEHYVVTVPTDDMEGMPNVVGVADADGQLLDDAPCANTHGEARLPDGAAAACQDGVLLVTATADDWDLTLVPYPDVDDEDPYGYGNARAWVLFSSPHADELVAPLGSRHVLSIDPASAATTAFEMDDDVALFGTAVDRDGRLVVLTSDGSLQVLDPDSGEVTDHTDVIDAFEEGDTAEPYRRLVLGDEHAYVSNPTSDTVVEVALDDLSITRTFELGVTPGFLGLLPG